jgi:thioredoxin reductase
MGLAAALGAVRRRLDVMVLEEAKVGASLLRWGATRFFSPLAMNLPPGVAAAAGQRRVADDALLTGPEFVESVLDPLSRSPELDGRVLTAHRVVAIGRQGLSRGDFAGHPLRSERPFRVLVDTAEGERTFEAEAVLDATGTYGQPVAFGAGGLLVPGERAASTRVVRDLGALQESRHSLAGQRVLLVGHGHSAAHALLELEAVHRTNGDTRVTWAVRSPNLRPCVDVASDPLPERQRVVGLVNQLAARAPEWLRVERLAQVETVASDEGALRVTLSGGRSVVADAVIALTGYRPNLSFLSELTLDIAPATEGAARLSRALSNVTDCLSVPSVSPADLASGEPDFHLIGAKSYGRSRTFLLRTGYAQLESILDGLVVSAS